MNTAQQIEAVAKEKASHEQNITSLKAALNAAADDGDLAEVKRIQTDISALQELIAACARRANKLQSTLMKEQQAAERSINDTILNEFKTVTERLAPQARKISKAVEALTAELQAFHSEAEKAGDHFSALVRKLPESTRSRHDGMRVHASFSDDFMGVLLCEEMRRAGIFTKLANTTQVNLQRLDLPPMGEAVESRVENLVKRLSGIHAQANAAIEQGAQA